MHNVALRLAYDGTNFVGSQLQAQGRTVQGVVEAAWEQLTQERRRFTLAGRTDAGVHALGQVANVCTETHHTLAIIKRGMNALLPDDVSVLQTWDVPEAFHARYSAVRRDYRYLIDPASVALPLLRSRCVNIPQPLHKEQMAQALAVLVGEHDFAAFAGAGSSTGSTVRHCYTASLVMTEMLGRELIAIDLAANAFLRHMVRNIVGTVLLVGQQRLDIEGVARVLHSGDRKQAGPTAPAHGLYLVSVGYPALPE